MRIAYQGTAGAFGEEALVQHFGEGASRLACASFDAVFAAVAEGGADGGVVPIENSLGGSILETYDLLLGHGLPIVGEVSLAVRHCLLAPPGTALDEVRRCLSHPQALTQCARFLAQRDIEPVAAANTAIAARDLAAGAPPGTAAIASARAARIHGLEVLADDIQTRSDNTTRFVIIARDAAGGDTADKATIAFWTRNEPGALLGCLAVIADRGLNLTRLESRPTGDTLWEYVFSADVEAPDARPLDAATMDGLLTTLAARSERALLLGRYPRAR